MNVTAATIPKESFDDIDYASKLIRLPGQSPSASSTSEPSFDDAMRKVLGSGHGGDRFEKEKYGREDKKLMDACFQMESLFVARMLKEMRTTVHKTGWINGGFAESVFEDMLYDEYALSLSKNSNLGLANMLYDQMKGKG
jgi:hypothetical protein